MRLADLGCRLAHLSEAVWSAFYTELNSWNGNGRLSVVGLLRPRSFSRS